MDDRRDTPRGRRAFLKTSAASAGAAATGIATALDSAAAEVTAGPSGMEAASVRFQPLGRFAKATSVEQKLREFVSVKDFGAVGDGIADDSAAFERAITSVSSGSSSGKIFVPQGTYKLLENLVIQTQVHLAGEGGVERNSKTNLLFANGKGIRIFHISDSPAGTNGSFSVISDLRIVAEYKTTNADGIYNSAHGVVVRSVSIEGYKGNGLRVEATAPAHGNANCCRFENIRITQCDGNGIFVKGPDSNACLFELMDCTSNGGWGIFDSSFLGNTYISCHVDRNGLGAYKTDNANARNVFLGCYSEGGQPPSNLVTPTLVLGGLHGAGFTPDSTAAIIEASSQNGGAVCSTGIGSSMVSGDDRLRVWIGNSPRNGDILYTDHTSSAPLGWRLKHTPQGLDFNYQNFYVVYRITGPKTTQTFGRASPVPFAFCPGKLWVGDGSNARHQTTGVSSPTAGEWARGDIVWNLNPVPGSNVGWICVTAGSPGIWKAFGLIAT